MNCHPLVSSRGVFASAVFAGLVFAGAARATTITLDTSQSPLGYELNQGWWDDGGYHTSSNSNTFTGYSEGTWYRSFYFFDLGLLGGQTVQSVTLRLYNSSSNLSSGASPWTVVFHDVTSDPQVVKNLDFSSTIYSDLGTGTVYGGATFSDFDTYVSFDLNADAIAAMNAQGTGYFGIGAMLLTTNGAFGYTNGDISYLDVTVGSNVPDRGATLWLIGLSLGGLALLRRVILPRPATKKRLRKT